MKYFYLSACCLFLAISAYGQSEVEPNGSFTQATPMLIDGLSDTISGAIAEPGDKDFFSVSIPRAGVLVADLSRVSEDLSMQLILLGSDSVAIGRPISGGNGRALNLEQSLCAAGTYYFRIASVFNAQASTSNYRFVVRLDTSDVYECNDEFETATSIAFDQQVEGQIFSKGDEDFYRLDVPRAGIIVARATSIDENINLQATIFRDDESKIGEETRSSGQAVELAEQICEAGIYYLRLKDQSNINSSEDSYSLLVRLDTSDIYECNNTLATAAPIATCDTILGSIGTAGDVDVYEISGVQNDTVTVSITNVSDLFGLQAAVSDQAEVELAATRASRGEALTLDFVPSVTEKYYLSLKIFGVNSVDTQLYNLVISDSKCDEITSNKELREPLFDIYPNPTFDYLTLRSTGNSELSSHTVEVYASSGVLLRRYTEAKDGDQLDVTDLPAGIVTVVVFDGSARHVRLIDKR